MCTIDFFSVLKLFSPTLGRTLLHIFIFTKFITKLHQFWDENDGENICDKNYFKVLRALSELPANWPGLTSLSSWIGWKGSWDLKIISMAYIFIIIFMSKLVSNFRKNFLCIAWHQKPTVPCHVLCCWPGLFTLKGPRSAAQYTTRYSLKKL